MFVPIVTSLIIIIIMFVFSFFVLKNVVKRINNSAKKYFLDKLQEYNYLVEDKEKKLNELINQVKEQEKILRNKHEADLEENDIFSPEIDKKLEEMRKFKQSKEIVYDIPKSDNSKENFFDTYKKLKKSFQVDTEKIIREFIKEHPVTGEMNIYKTLKQFRKQFTDKTIYECLILKPKDQYELIKEVINDQIAQMVNFDEKYKNPNKFTINKFIENLDELITSYNPNIYIYVSSEDINYDNIDERIRTKIYRNMSEGIVIYYRGKIYDYSI